jgi:ribosomal protein S18 acetylase RimI-like enzyme
MSIKVIKADQTHAATIALIGRQSFRDAFGNLFNRREELNDYLDYTYKTEKIIASLQKENNEFFLACVDSVPVGFAKVKKHSLNDQIESGAQMELQKIYVLSYYHGSGAGPALIQAVLDLAQELKPDFVWLDTHISNAKAIHFYGKYGFKKYGIHYFTIGTQTFEYYLMSLPVAAEEVSLSYKILCYGAAS